MELKLKKRELKITLYDGDILRMEYPKKWQHDKYIADLVKRPEDENEITRDFYIELGMTEEQFREIQQPDLFEIGMIITGQKKI